MPQKTVVYASVGPELTQYDVDVDKATLTRRGNGRSAGERAICLAARLAAIPLCGVERQRVGRRRPGRPQAQCQRVPHRSGNRRAEVAWRADRAADPADPYGERHSVAQPSGRLQQPGGLSGLSGQCGRHAGRGSPADGAIDPGIYGHRCGSASTTGWSILVTRGHDAAGGKPEEPGALKVFDYRQRAVDQRGLGGARGRFRLRPASSRFPSDKAVGLCVAWSGRTSSTCSRLRRRAVAGAVIQQRHVGRARQHPRAAGRRHDPCPPERPLCLCRQPRLEHSRDRRPTGFCRRRKHAGGLCDRSDDRRARPDPACRHTRHPLPHLPHRSGRPCACRGAYHGAAGQGWRDDPRGAACLSVFRIGSNGKLEFVRKYDVEVGDRQMFWMGMV